MATPAVSPSNTDVVPVSEPIILTGRELRFVEKFLFLRVGHEHPEVEAAQQVGLRPKEGKRLLRQKHIRAEIQRRSDIIDREVAAQIAASQALTVETLDAELLKAAKAPMDKGIAPAKVKALEIAYGRLRIPIGEREDRPESGSGLLVYRALGKKIENMTVRQIETQRVTEVIHHSDEQVTVEAKQLPESEPKTIDVEIENY